MSDEYLDALATALENEVSSFTGRFVSWRDMMIAPRPIAAPRPPLWVGGNTPAMARRAGRRGDGWIPWQIAREEFVERAAIARDAHRASGRGGSFAARRARRRRTRGAHAGAAIDASPTGARPAPTRVARRLTHDGAGPSRSSCSNGSPAMSWSWRSPVRIGAAPDFAARDACLRHSARNA